MSEITILTDIGISQCPKWGEKTDYLYGSVGRQGRLRSFLLLVKLARHYDVVITANIQLAQLYGLWRSLTRWKRPRQIILELMLDEARDDFIWKIKIFIQRLCFSSVERIFVSSSDEITSYSARLRIPESRFFFLPFHTNVIEPKFVEGTGYIFSAGRTGRDFATLAAAVKGLDVQVVVVSDVYHLEGIVFPPNVDVHCDIPYQQYLQLLNGCSLVVVPLKKLVKSTGQVVFLEAMALGKPVIASFTTGTKDYIENDVTGVLVPPEDVDALRVAIQRYIDGEQTFHDIAERAMVQIQKQHTFEIYVDTILDEAEKLVRKD